MSRAVLVILAGLLVGCAAKPAPQACYRMVAGLIPWDRAYWVNECHEYGGGVTVSHDEVWPTRYRYQGGGLQPY